MRALRLCLVTNIKNTPFKQYKAFLRRAIEGGVTSVQFREKSLDFAEYRERAIQIKSITDQYGIPLIINDHVILAKEIDAAGVHVGSLDMSPLEVEAIFGPNKIIGYSVETWEELHSANQLSCLNYIGASAVFRSKTKPDCKTYWGLEGLRKISEISENPVVAIGGINQSNIADVIQYCDGVAVVGAIHDFADPQAAAENLISKIHRGVTLCCRR